MEHGDSIVGEHIQAILEQLKNGKTLVRMKLVEKNFEELSVINDIRKKGKLPFLLIDCPDGFDELVKDSSRKLLFEYSGVNKLPYFFYAGIAQIDQNIIWVTVPDLIERRQLRRDFRVDIPTGAHMGFKKYGVRFNKRVINLSLGGSFGALIRSQEMTQSQLPISVGDTLTEIELIFQSKHFEQQVNIRKAVVVRFEENPLLGSSCYALHFLDMDKTEEKALTELIYVIQREYLKKRLTIAD
jgi:hypothetical protein